MIYLPSRVERVVGADVFEDVAESGKDLIEAAWRLKRELLYEL